MTQNTTKQNLTRKIIIILQIITIPIFNLIPIHHFKTTFLTLSTLSTYKYIYFKTTFMCPRSIAGVSSSQALHPTCARSCCTWRASCVDSKPKINIYIHISECTFYQDCALTSEVPKRFKGPTKAYRDHKHLN